MFYFLVCGCFFSVWFLHPFRVKECKVTNKNDDRTAYLIHSMQPSGAICYNQRLAVQQLSTSPNLEFKFRSFRFSKIDDSADDKDTQHQTVSCKIHLDPLASVPQTPTDCSCFSPSKGFNDRFWLSNSALVRESLLKVNVNLSLSQKPYWY